MIKTITVTNPTGETLVLELTSPEKSGLIVRNIEGLGPSKANINVNEIATMDGGVFNSGRVTTRNIVITLSPMFAPTIEDARQKTYRYFPVNKRVKLLIETDNRIAEVYGYVESNEPTIFSREVSIQISIVCPNAYLYSAGGGVSIIFSGVEPQFEFSFSNESISEDLLEFGEIKDESSGLILYEGDADIGMTMTIHALGFAEEITIYNVDTRETMIIDTDKIETLTGEALSAGDDIVISTVKGDKYALLLRNGAYTNIINCLDQNSDWFQLTKGENIFVYTATTGEENLEFKVEFNLAYEGV